MKAAMLPPGIGNSAEMLTTTTATSVTRAGDQAAVTVASLRG